MGPKKYLSYSIFYLITSIISFGVIALAVLSTKGIITMSIAPQVICYLIGCINGPLDLWLSYKAYKKYYADET